MSHQASGQAVDLAALRSRPGEVAPASGGSRPTRSSRRQPGGPAGRLRLRQRSRGPRAGFTLIEIVLAAGLLAIGLSALIGLFSFGANLVTGARLQTQAAQALESLVADLPGQLFPLSPEGQVGPPLVLKDQPVPGYPRLRFDALPSPTPVSASDYPGPPLWSVEVTVAWKSRGQGRGLSARILLPQSLPLAERLRRAVTQAPAASSGP
jgi:type II secretory pathway pseudopilin PulG